MKLARFAVSVLVIAFVVMLVMLITFKESSEPERSRILAKTDLEPLTLVNDANLEARSDGQNAPDIKRLSDRYLLVSVKQGVEVKDEMVAPRDATTLLSDAVALSIPASATTVVGNQLRRGDLVDLVAVLPKEGAGVKKFEKLMVLVPANKDTNPNAIVLAVPGAQRDEFSSALVGTQLLVTRKIGAIKP
jgi:hypothetical protein